MEAVFKSRAFFASLSTCVSGDVTQMSLAGLERAEMLMAGFHREDQELWGCFFGLSVHV